MIKMKLAPRFLLVEKPIWELFLGAGAGLAGNLSLQWSQAHWETGKLGLFGLC